MAINEPGSPRESSSARTSTGSSDQSVSAPPAQAQKSGERSSAVSDVAETGITVLCRVRPHNDKEQDQGFCVTMEDGSNSVTAPSINETFSFDACLGPDSTQQEVYERAALGVVEDFMRGINGTVFAYGQTGSGKTHTMAGEIDLHAEGRGLVPRVISGIFDHIADASDQMQFQIKVSYIEIYNEKVRCLIGNTAGDKETLRVRERKGGQVYVEGAQEMWIGCEQDAVSVLTFGGANRAIGETQMNKDSSRSHSIFSLYMEQTNALDGSKKMSKLNLVDLAGSESVGKSGASGQSLDEAKMINKSLSSLTSVIHKLSDEQGKKSSHVPYRDSKLTMILKDALGGNCRTSLIVCCSPATSNAHETCSTLRFGRRAKAIKNKARVNTEPSALELKDAVAQLQRKNTELYAEVEALKEERSMLLNHSDAAEESARMVDDLRAALRMERARADHLKEERREQEDSRHGAGGGAHASAGEGPGRLRKAPRELHGRVHKGPPPAG